MKPLAAQLYRVLADGAFHSGEALARGFGVSRASVWNAVRELGAMQLEVFAVRGRGYRLAHPVSLLDAARVARHLGARAAAFSIEVCEAVDSTNTALLARAGAPTRTVLAAEWQSGGRGRRGRAWHAGLGGALTFSLAWRFARGAAGLSGLSLAVGLAIARALEAAGAQGISLKWPNDVLWRGRKLAGILVELAGDALGPALAVIGIGLNVRLAPATRERIGRGAADLASVLGEAPDRNRLLALLLLELEQVLSRFERSGFGALRAQWRRYDAHEGRRVTLLLPDGTRARGTARAVAEDGALVLETRAGLRRFHGGEVSLRAAGPGRAREEEAAAR
jgi:BirA family biotin operon repressor/biotin-[acetyl-CoA-carboxylase] ligase